MVFYQETKAANKDNKEEGNTETTNNVNGVELLMKIVEYGNMSQGRLEAWLVVIVVQMPTMITT